MAKQYEVIDNCVVPAKLAPVLRELKADTGAVLNSCYRGHDANALLKQLGKKSQKELYEGWVARRPGFNPANPPGRSTHELRNDGVAFPGPVGMPLPWYAVGIDISNPGGVCAAAAKRGFTATVTYPNNSREKHHINFRKEPKLAKVAPVLKKGSKGPLVAALTRRLAFVKSPDDRKPYLAHAQRTFDDKVEAAVRRYQAEHEQKADGIVGPQTARQLGASVRWWKLKKREQRAERAKDKEKVPA